MRYLATYENYKLIESFDYEPLLEGNKMKTYKTIQEKTIKKLGINLYFAATYTWGVTMLYPIVDALIKNSNIPNITPEQIVLLTLFCITQILNMVSNDVNKLKEKLEEDNLLHLINKIKKSLLSIYKIFKFVSRSFGKVIDSFTDMVAYVSLGIPFTSAIVELISKDGLDLETLPQKTIVFSGGAALYVFKSIVETIISIIKNKMNLKKQN